MESLNLLSISTRSVDENSLLILGAGKPLAGSSVLNLHRHHFYPIFHNERGESMYNDHFANFVK
jgi:hypothetical protein